MTQNYLVISHDLDEDGGVYMDFVRADSEARACALVARLRASHISGEPFCYTPEKLRALADELQFETPERIREELRFVARTRFFNGEYNNRPSICVGCEMFVWDGHSYCDACRKPAKAS